MAKTATKTAPVTTDTAVPAGTEMDIPATLIVADPEFNARKDLDSKNDEGHSIKSLAHTIKEDGQLTPVLVAVVREYPGKYFLVSGFRRFKAICGSKEEGGLGKMKIRATVFQRLDSKGNPEAITIKDLYYLNLIENEARKALNPYERGQRYHELVKKHGESGNAIAKRVSLDPSYVNRLVAAMDMHPRLIERWAEEWSGDFEGTKILTTDKINLLTKMKKEGSDKQDHEAQLEWLEKTLNPTSDDEDADEEGGDGDSGPDKDKRTSLSQIKRALAAAEAAHKVKASAFTEGVIEALKFAIKPRKIDGVLSVADKGKTIKGHDGKAVAAPKA